MVTYVDVLLTTALSGANCALMLPRFRLFALRFGLVDKPTVRKQHLGEVPTIGGLVIFMSVMPALLIVTSSISIVLPLLIGAVLLVLGALDDKLDLRASVRLPVQLFTALLMIFIGGFAIENIGNLFGYGPVLMNFVISIFFTMMCTVGVVNSTNMIDGVDGLSGTMTAITLAVLGYFSFVSGDMASVALISSLIMAIAVFLVFNSRIFRKQAIVFMGDAGTTLLGFLLVWYFVKLTQGDSAVLSPVAAGWIFGLPMIDTVAVMITRTVEGRSPLEADRKHLHHRLLDAGFCTNRVVLIMSMAQLALVTGGLLCNMYRSYEPLFFWGFVSLCAFYFILIPRLLVGNRGLYCEKSLVKRLN